MNSNNSSLSTSSHWNFFEEIEHILNNINSKDEDLEKSYILQIQINTIKKKPKIT